ncbi:Pentatricopeptide repeat-containing protein [Hibiscus syriacus]|uniref:Pentatricopeptide repeat-containing protein n=1 Tax=Hibiscus syriacus TaxID=106335 RepID=A0A6A2YM27_HIBSY|nr:Pentatricopeptide repeat-containing protein [Hibiscus syriacus]
MYQTKRPAPRPYDSRSNSNSWFIFLRTPNAGTCYEPSVYSKIYETEMLSPGTASSMATLNKAPQDLRLSWNSFSECEQRTSCLMPIPSPAFSPLNRICRMSAVEAFELLKLMRFKYEKVNEYALSSVLSALADPELLSTGRQIHCLTVKNGLLVFVSVGNALVTMYAKCGSLDDALKAFELSSDKNSITCDVPAVEEGKQVHGYLLKSRYESQVYIMTALVDMYAKCGNTIDARKGFDYLQHPDMVLWTSMIGGYVQKGDNENAMNLYGRMWIEGIMPNELTMASILKVCSCLAALEQGKQIHACTIKHGFGLEVPIGSALSTMYAKCGSLEDGSLEMLLEGTEPEHVTFVNLLSACSHMGLVETCWAYFDMMSDKFGIVPRVEHYACMVDILGRAGKLDEAKEFIESATIDHGMCLWLILLSACRNFRNYELGAYAGEKLMELGSQESSAYVLLSSIYIALGRLEDVERVRRLMRLRGVNKEPGCSWIELKDGVHVFVVGDQMHPEIKAVRE